MTHPSATSPTYRFVGLSLFTLAAGSAQAQWTATVLHPAGSTDSYAQDVAGGQQVGYANVSGQVHAGLWSGTPGSWINLHPTGATESQAFAAGAGQQAGFVKVGSTSHASLWSGTPGSLADLHAFLPPGYDQSFALGLSTDGTNLYVSGYAVSTSGHDHAVLWSAPVAAGCPADFNGDGFVTGDDFDAFVSAFELGDAAADFDADGFVTGDDFDAYVLAFEAGC